MALTAAAALAAAAGAPPAGAQVNPVEGRQTPPTQVIVRFSRSAGDADRLDARRRAHVRHRETLPIAGMQVVDPEPGTSVPEAVAALEREDGVLYAEPDVSRVAF